MEQSIVIQEELDCTVEGRTFYLLKCLQLVLPIVPAKSNQTPIIENFLIDISGGYLKATGYDNKNTIVAEQELEGIQGSVKLCVNAHILVNLLKTLPALGEIKLLFRDNNLKIISESGSYQLFGENENLYPQIKYSTLTETLVLDGNLVARLIAINYACSNDDLRPAMKGICINFKDDYTEFVATNGYIIHLIRRHDIKINHASIVIPGKELSSLSDIIKNRDYIKLSLMKNHVAFSTDDSKYVTSKIDERFPDYEWAHEIPIKYKLKFKKSLILLALERINILQPTGDIITFVISQQNKILKAHSAYGAVEENFVVEEYTKVDTTAEDEITISCYLKKLLLALKHLDSIDLFLSLSVPDKILTLMPVTQQPNEEIRSIVAPVITPTYHE